MNDNKPNENLAKNREAYFFCFLVFIFLVKIVCKNCNILI